ncbi:chromosome segregation protein SMC [Thermoactinomyces sp. DSM 45891]|uniref:chromosome segregation protein SMC n=1 Tax=Thermoactinomyces sp. DSM 45891 TaxID=1761907 RepID=UPI00256FE8CA|nr:chromosome segregation protein SMC [Thermoactinomyces sp. DSM 45891]
MAMYLKRLEMSGFKSFANRTELEFVPGITAVVGPNGSGKSNVTDGIRWVLGEQSAKSLRGSKMEDVIFAGSDTRKPVGFCEVAITFDNTERRLPLDYAEVTVARRVYRSGESEYLLNKQTCRLKDINELFMDTGIGKEAYSMIGQGKIEEIMSSKSEDRRAIFEEAAGIVKYKSRKKEAEKKLETTEQNLARIHDLIHELDAQVGPLAEQSEKAITYKELKAELEQVEIGLYVHKIEDIHDKWQSSAQEVKRRKEEQAILSAELNKREVYLQEVKMQVDESEARLEQVQGELLKASEDLEKAEGQREVWLERGRNREATKQQLQERHTALQEEETRLQLEISEFQKRLSAKEMEAQAAETELHTVLEQMKLTVQEASTPLQEVMQQIQECNNEVITLKSEQQFVEQQRTELAERLSLLMDHLSEVYEQREDMEEMEEDSRKQLQKIKSTLEQKREEANKVVEKRNTLQEEEKSLSHQNRVLEQKYHRTRSQYDVLKEMEAEHAGFFQGVKEILLAADRGHETLSGVRGAVAQLVQVSEKYEIAMETALGGAVQNVVVEDEQTGRYAIRFLKDRRLGRATFLPLDVIQPRVLPSRDVERINKVGGFIGIAKDLVSCEPEYQGLVENLLGLVVVAQNLEIANQLARSLQYRYRVVTLDGDVINPGGGMTGGSRQNNKSNLLGRARQLEELETELHEQKQEWDSVQADLKATTEQRTHLEKTWEELRAEGEQLRLQEQQMESNLRESQIQLQNVEKTIEQGEQQQRTVDEKTMELENRTHVIGQALDSLEEQKKSLTEKRKELEELRKQEVSSKAQANEQVTEWRIMVAQLKQEIRNSKENMTRIQSDLLRNQKQQKQLVEERVTLGERGELNKQELDQLSARIAQLREQKIAIQEKLSKVRGTRDEQMRERNELEHEVHQAQSTIRKQEEQLRDLEIRVNRLDVELNHLLQKLAEEYEISFERAKEMYGAPEEPNQAERNVRSLKQQIASLGEVSLGAIEEYKRLSERLEFLQTQEADLLDAKRSLYDLIAQIESEMGKRFLDVFQLIREEFLDVFVKMFGGGRADLQLTDENNLLETGIEIVAQPPGKKLQQLSLLSGGERSLVALALLFAVLRVKPVPFCFLDEVDAALDEANLTRFVQYMKEAAVKTQFILITHRKHTMEGADVLYGITMQESGVSSLVSVRMEDYDDSSKEVAATMS